jgi:uncharacterized protein YbgA (DUF1722 family)/uncharacterized protein YbbK (DUF523 family)
MRGGFGGRPRVGVSSCLLGEEVRFNGGHKRYRFLTDELGRYVDWVAYCPEMEIGLGTPREPIRLTAAGRLVNRGGTADHTAAMTALPLPADLDGYVFKAKSPSCGIRAIPRYRADSQPADQAGRGLYAARVLGAFPLLAAEDEGRLNDPGLREAFVERIFAAARLRSALSGPWSAGDLVAFHARHKLQMLAHDPARYRSAGRVVAGTAPREQTVASYRDLFLAAMASPATRGRNANALQHAYRRIGQELDRPRRHDLLARIDAYRRGEEPLSVPIALLAHYALGLPWLAEQTYLRPFPPDLRLRHSVSAEAG